jgi:hypothetical protein
MGNALLVRGNRGVPRSKAVEFTSNVAGPRVGLDSRVPFRGLTLVNSHKPKAADRNIRTADPLFSAAEMRHNFAIWALEKSATSRRRLHLYYCVRCKWAFRVDDYSGLVTPLDQKGNLVLEPEAAEKLATFANGPCPVFSRLTGNRRFTQLLAPSNVTRGRRAALFYAISRIWKRPNRGWRRTASPGRRQNLKRSTLQ